MFRQSITAAAFLCLMVQMAQAEAPPFRVSLLDGGHSGDAWRAGVRIELEPGWKTYWRMPGEAGIPPEFTWTAKPPASVTVSFPTPARYQDASGETVGYEREVLFPVLAAHAEGTPLRLELKLFFAVCREVCIPARAEAAIDLGASPESSSNRALVDAAIAKLPSAGDTISGARLSLPDGKPVLELDLRESVEDIFVETTGPAYFRAPRFSADGRQASLPIDNVKDPADMKGAVLKLTYVRQGVGLEQDVTLP